MALIAILAAGGLFVLQRWHNQAAHQAAAQAVAERGQWLAMSLALRAAAAAEAAGADAGDQTHTDQSNSADAQGDSTTEGNQSS